MSKLQATLGSIAFVTLSSCGSKQEAQPAPSPEPKPTTYAQRILGALDRASVEKTRLDMRAIGTAVEAYASQNGEYPESASNTQLAARLSPTFIHVLPLTDAWGSAFIYERTADGWSLTAPGEDDSAGTGDDIVLTDAGFTKLPDGYRDM